VTSLKQIEANRRNALKSTGPISAEGKDRSRMNAVRHGLTAETVIGSLEDAEDYAAFEAAVIADYNADTAVQRELVLRLASILWRLRRSTAIESALLKRWPASRPRQSHPGQQWAKSSLSVADGLEAEQRKASTRCRLQWTSLSARLRSSRRRSFA
jgi:hypothetical protein